MHDARPAPRPAPRQRTAAVHPVQIVLAAVERLPGVKVTTDPGRGSAEVEVAGRPVARIDLRHGGVLVEAPPDGIPTLLSVFPCSRVAEDGIAFQLADGRHCAQAAAAIHRRVMVERFLPQLRVASP
jgi:hypothetical protein